MRVIIQAEALRRSEGHYYHHFIHELPTIDAVSVVRCKDCIYFHPAHVLTHDGKEKSYNEMPPEAFGGLDDGLVTATYGVNVGSKCELGKGASIEDKSVFRNPDDYCSRGIKRDGGAGE